MRVSGRGCISPAYRSYFTNAPIQNHIHTKQRGYIGDLKANRTIVISGKQQTVSEWAKTLTPLVRTKATLIPNVMPFEQPPPPPDEYSSHLRADLGIAADALLVLQPTRVVPRKRIERAIELVARLARPATLLISHAAVDEGLDYAIYLRDYAALLDVHVLFGSDLISDRRGTTATGQRVYSLADAYQHSDLVTYPSVIEGFGNAFLEALYFRRPIVLSAYDIYR